jgi:hypothetical protein
MPHIVLLDRGIQWGYRDMEPVGPFSEEGANEFATKAREWIVVEQAVVLSLNSIEEAAAHSGVNLPKTVTPA